MTAPAAKPRQPSRDKILDCAEQLFARRGFAGIGLAEVADGVELSTVALPPLRQQGELYGAGGPHPGSRRAAPQRARRRLTGRAALTAGSTPSSTCSPSMHARLAAPRSLR
jgi:hypothetical protein